MVAQAQHRSGSSRAQALAAHAGRWRTRASDAGVGGADARRVSSRSMINEMMLCEELFHTPTGVAFADFITDGHRETWPIRSKSFRTWVRRCYYQATGSAAGAAMIRSALNLLEARAQFDAAERAVNIRVAEHDGRLYLDLADEHWRAVAIGPDGWRVLGCPPVRFRRSPGMLPLPVPERGGSIEALRRSSIFRTRTTLCWSSHGCWPRCDQAVPIRCSQYPASRARRRQSYQSSSGRWSIPMRPRSERSRARNAS